MAVTENKDKITVLLNTAYDSLYQARLLSTNPRLSSQVEVIMINLQDVDEHDSYEGTYG